MIPVPQAVRSPVAVTRRAARAIRAVPLALALAAAPAVLPGCSAGGNDEAAAARDRARARAGWTLTLEDGGAAHAAALERMDLYVGEDDSEPERFEIRGDGVVLVGRLPADLHVGYEEAFDRLAGRELALDAHGGDPSEPKSASVTLSGRAVPVTGGMLRVEKVTGRWSGSEGDRTLHGAVELRVPSADGERTVRGRFAVHVVTWG